jgi:hypothetical protein
LVWASGRRRRQTRWVSVDPGGFEVEAGGAGAAAGGDQYLVGLQPPGIPRDGDLQPVAVAGATGRGGGGRRDDLSAEGLEVLLEGGGDLRLFEGGDPVECLDEGHLGAQVREELAELEPDGVGSHNDQLGGQHGEVEGGG